LFNLFEIRTYKEIREDHSDEELSDDDVRKELAKRIGDVMHKKKEPNVIDAKRIKKVFASVN